MALIHRDIPGLYAGVSQQAPPLRMPNQMTEQINFLSSVTTGIEKRQGTRHVAVLNSNTSNKALSYPFRDSEGREYVILFTGNASEPIEVFLMPDGTKCTVTYESEAAKQYLLKNATGIPRNDIRIAAIADYAMVVNRNVKCAMTSKKSPVQNPFAIYWVERGFTSTTYTLGDKSHTTESSQTNTSFSTKTICEAMCGLVQGLTQLNSGSVARIEGGSVAALTCSDSYGNQASSLIKGKVNKETDLPPCAGDGDVVEITGENNDTLTSYYMKYSKEDNLWSECVAPGLPVEFDASTLPHQLIRTDATQFLFRPSVEDEENNRPGWQERKTGDDITAPIPSFIGSSIRDIFYHKNRLAFLSGQNVIMSQPNDYFNFFPTSTATTLDTDPMDRAVGFNEPVVLEWAIPFKEDLLLFTKDKQFMMTSGNEVFTAMNAMIDLVTSYPCSTLVRPISLGSSVVFASDSGKYSLVREYFVDSDSMQNSAADITAHCPRYLPNKISRVVHLPNAGVLFYWSEERKNELSVYAYYWQGNEKPQSSWSKFIFPFDILTMEQFGEILYLFVKQDGKIRLSTLDITGDDVFLFDEQFTPSHTSYDEATNTTTIQFRYPCSSAMSFVSVPEQDMAYMNLTEVSRTNTSVTVYGNWRDTLILCGIPFESKCSLSEFFVSPDGKTGALQGRLQLRSLTLSFIDTGRFDIEVTYPGRSTMTHHYTGVVVNEAFYAKTSLRTERRRFMIQGDASKLSITITNNGILPSTFDSLSFEGLYHVRTQRT